MSLSALIKKGGLKAVATATPATSATENQADSMSVATVATIAVANHRKPVSEPSVATDLRQLVDLVATFHGFSTEEHDEALEIAFSDPSCALECFKRLGEEIYQQFAAGIRQPISEMRVEAM